MTTVALGIICLIIGSILELFALMLDFQTDDNTIHGSSIIASVGTLTFFIGCFLISDGKNPEAIDVYRNRTTLKVTYVDSVAVDSVVVFK